MQGQIFIFGALGYFQLGAPLEGFPRLMSYKSAAVAYAENFHGGFHSVAYGRWPFVFGVRCLWRHNLTS